MENQQLLGRRAVAKTAHRMVALTVDFWEESTEDNMTFSTATTECFDVIVVGGGDTGCEATFTDPRLGPIRGFELHWNSQLEPLLESQLKLLID